MKRHVHSQLPTCPDCGKVCHPTEHSARKAALRRLSRHYQAEQPAQLRTYKCRFCGYYHLTSKPERERIET